jgi:hypothetical protein
VVVYVRAPGFVLRCEASLKDQESEQMTSADVERPRCRQSLDPPRLLAHALYGELYNDLGGDYFRKRDPARMTRRLVAQLEATGTASRCRRPRLPESYFPVSQLRHSGFSAVLCMPHSIVAIPESAGLERGYTPDGDDWPRACVSLRAAKTRISLEVA